MSNKKTFTRYEIFVIAILAILQFTIILDFMVLSPLGAILMPALRISTAQFGMVVSAYAFSAGLSGLLAAGFADRYDRKNFLLFFYTGFLIGTMLCALAPTYELLLAARIVTGIFGGVIGSVSFAIITDLFRLEVRGRVMGFVQMAFGASQVLGLPIGLSLANRFGWHSPFWMIVGFGIAVGVVMVLYLKPVDTHLQLQTQSNAFSHLRKTLTTPLYGRVFLSTILLATGGFMLMPFGSAYSTNNLGLTLDQLPLLYLTTGIFGLLTGPLIGKLSDTLGRLQMFLAGSVLSAVMIGIYTNLGITPLWICMVLNVLLFAGINARMISASALTSAIPAPHDRGAFMSINSSIQQISGGVASFVAGLIVVQTPSGLLNRYDVLGYVVIGSMVLAAAMIYWLNGYIQRNTQRNPPTATIPDNQLIES
jgi:predicted MFS family arabinose efflux permease